MNSAAWQSLRPGDGLVILIAALFSAWLATNVWRGDAATRVIIRAGGAVVQQLSLDRDQRIVVAGPLGHSVVEVTAGRARVASDPSPRQLCVKQGWLRHAGDAAICLPNQLSVELAGATRRYDSVNY